MISVRRWIAKRPEKALPPLERYIYRADREGFTQSEIARELGIDQSTVSRKLDRLYDRMNVVRLYDGERTKKETCDLRSAGKVSFGTAL